MSFNVLDKSWEIKTIGDFVTAKEAEIQTGPFGTMLQASSYTLDGTPVIAVKDIGVNKIVHGNSPLINDEDAERLSRYKLLQGDIIFGRKGAVDRRALVTKKEEGWIQGSDCIRIRFKSSKIDPVFVSYFLGTKFYINWIVSNAQGTTMPSLNQEILKRVPLPIPTIAEQRRIVSVLKVIDEKIEINNAINNNLEEVAQVLFKRWFVDFEFPNINGEPYKSSGGEFEESELGLMPKGWRLGTLSDLGEVVGGATPSKSKEEYYTTWGIPWITPKDLSLNKNKYISRGQIDITKEGFKSSSTRLLPKGTVLFSSRAPIGYIAISKNEVTTNQGFKSLIPFEHIGSEFLYYVLKFSTETIENRASGSTFKEISGSEMKRVPVIIPSFDVVEQFNIIVESVGRMVEKCESESDSLIHLRDSLLPKLMSGEIQVPLKQDILYSHSIELPLVAENKAQYPTT